MNRDFPNHGRLQLDDATQEGTFTSSINGTIVPVKQIATEPTDNGPASILQTADGKTFYASGGRIIYRSGPVAGWEIPRMLLNLKTGAPAVDINTAIPHSIPETNWRAPYTNRGMGSFISKRFQPGFGGAIFKDMPQPPPPSNNVQLWTISGQSPVPQMANQPVVLISTLVPISFRLRLANYTFRLLPAQTFENNYIWRIQVGGFDVLNPYDPIPPTGRPTRSDDPVQFSPEVRDLLVIDPGTPIIVTVQAVAPIASNDLISCALIGTLWGDK